MQCTISLSVQPLGRIECELRLNLGPELELEKLNANTAAASEK